MSPQGILHDEIKQTRPFRSLTQEAVLGLFRTADILRRSFAQLMEEHGLTLQQYNVLRILRGAGERGLPTLTIAERMVERTPGITRLVDRLLRKELVERERPPGDRRQVVCRITPRGLALLAELDGPVGDLDDRCLAMLDEDEHKTLIDILDRVRQA
ncbi:MAG TPA: MarR family transcriptional regulator [Thermoanaerobaculia bacterium]|jgi:DNA-binding MarR family transcriptional regulator